jgi:GMP synthase (glutamine-hydrolysing)
MKHAAVIQHLAFEDLGSLEPALRAANYAIEWMHAGVDDLAAYNGIAPDLLIVLGGPIGVYDTTDYPFIADELRLLAPRLAAKRRTLGICLGAQLIAAALGARVFPGDNGKEIGWSALQPASADAKHSVIASLFEQDVQVLHWHGDTYELPPGATHLAASGHYEQQAFSVGNHTLAFQCHPEVQLKNLERWYIGHTVELGKANVSIPTLREASRAHASRLEKAANVLWERWLEL